jgi:hypothetical protein
MIVRSIFFLLGLAVGLAWMPFWRAVGEVAHDRMFEKGHM